MGCHRLLMLEETIRGHLIQLNTAAYPIIILLPSPALKSHQHSYFHTPPLDYFPPVASRNLNQTAPCLKLRVFIYKLRKRVPASLWDLPSHQLTSWHPGTVLSQFGTYVFCYASCLADSVLPTSAFPLRSWPIPPSTDQLDQSNRDVDTHTCTHTRETSQKELLFPPISVCVHIHLEACFLRHILPRDYKKVL